MDQLDKEILLVLQEKGRITMTELGKEVLLSQPAVTERVRRIEEKGIIDHYRAVVKAEKVNNAVTAFLLFHTKTCEHFVDACSKSNEVVELHRISGQYNFLVKMVSETLHTLETAINEMGTFGDSTTLIVLSSPIENKKIIPILKN
ncbi:Lrp/AsnC family transcriptional regulator [Alkalihalobacillus pseudalcaliphilus]|uniref:Lrp/AsnC family transcriptional regulator n=1 Tax=Alkalihalobacillus pseudalcaliphilus TaxID=79884 RepID=UPI00064DAFF3|nr:Lrp/AsnC family transcriptional regulator [Alkalihalobacillus pseudalcaliphilus]KMK75620.1 AsnC family transcriptional regulator [Alkalihalobacillus pseudalcaliphilus]